MNVVPEICVAGYEPMPVRCLSFVTYSESGSDWHLEKVANPAWDRIVAAVHRLDRFRYPWVWLFIGEEDEDATVDCLTIMGGGGVYWVGLSAGPYIQRRLFDPSKGQHEVPLWTSDQGFADRACYVTEDVEIVLRIAKHFGETGEPLPGAGWEPQ
jgi:hypothetical protein